MADDVLRENIFDASLFGEREHVGVVRGLGELRARRPVLISANDEKLMVLPVDGIDSSRLAAFRNFCAPAMPKLIVSARRARALGYEVGIPLALTLAAGMTTERLLSLVADPNVEHPPLGQPASPAGIAAITLAKIAQGLPAVLAAQPNAAKIASFDPPLITIDAASVAQYRSNAVDSLRMLGEARIPLNSGASTRFVSFCDELGESSVAIIVGDPSKPARVRLHSACLTGDVFGSRRCDCGDQLKLSLTRLEQTGGGIILYLAQEGRGLGLANKLRTYQLQDAGLDTVDANTTLGFDDDERDYRVAARMLEILGHRRVVLLTNNPAKLSGLANSGIEIVGRMAIEAPITADNCRYLTAKAVRAGHHLGHLVGSRSEPAKAGERMVGLAP
jgi:GTP cyclohydrolase II